MSRAGTTAFRTAPLTRGERHAIAVALLAIVAAPRISLRWTAPTPRSVGLKLGAASARNRPAPTPRVHLTEPGA